MNASVRTAGGTVTRRRGTRITIVAGLVIASASVVTGLAVASAGTAQWTPVPVAITLFLVAALLRPFEPAPGEKFTLGAAIALFAAVVLPAGPAVAAVAVGALTAKLVRRTSFLSSAVNVAQLTAATGAASLAVRVLGGVEILALVVAGIAYSAVTLAAVGAMVVASSGRREAASFVAREWLPTAGLVSVGAIGALLWERDAVAILLLAIPLALIEIGLRRIASERAAMQALHEAQAAQRQFTEDAAHELRTPLTALLGDLSFVRRENLRPDEAAALADAERTATAMQRLTERLLVLSRSGLPHAADCGDLADAVRWAVARAAPRPGVAVRLSLPSTVEVAVPVELLEVIASDVVGNAAAYTERGSIDIHTEIGDAAVTLVVSDTGIGIDAADLQRVFDRFFRSARARSLGPGSGLGLSIVQSVAHAYGGSITVTSAPDRGTQVRIRLPSARTEALPAPAEQPTRA